MVAEKHYEYVVVDLETSRNSSYKHEATPYDPVNKIVLEGARARNRKGVVREQATPASDLADSVSNAEWVVAHNAAFDMAWANRRFVSNGGVRDWVRDARIWDTQVAEYILSRQTVTFPSLDYCSSKRGGSVKDDRISKMWEAGVKTEDMPKEMLVDYLKGDLRNTEIVFLSQVQEAAERKMLPLLISQMEARAATIEMNINGMAIDRKELTDFGTSLSAELDAHMSLAINQVRFTDIAFEPNFASPKQLSLILFGGNTTEKVKQQDGHYKNGNPRFKTISVTKPYKGFGLIPTSTLNGQGYYSTDDAVLKTLLKTGGPASHFIAAILNYREVSKQLGTYVEGIQKAIMPDGLLHPNHNHCVTKTGRLSSSDPNLQNITNGEIKKVFVSRWGSSGVILEADFSQLEVVALAWLSRDKQLVYDITHGIDIHTALFNDLYGRHPTTTERKSFKRLSFGLIYGAGAATLSQNAGVSEQTARDFIATFYNRYPNVKLWQETNIRLVDSLSYYDGDVKKASVLKSATGREYFFRQYEAPDWLKHKSDYTFSPTEIKNYPVQGLATGDIVPLALGKLYRRLMADPVLKDRALLINTVHDSVLLDVHVDVVEQAAQFVKDSLERTHEDFKETFGETFDLPLEVKVSVGPNWLDQTELHFPKTTEKVAA